MSEFASAAAKHSPRGDDLGGFVLALLASALDALLARFVDRWLQNRRPRRGRAAVSDERRQTVGSVAEPTHARWRR
jgi:hypothetical protein